MFFFVETKGNHPGSNTKTTESHPGTVNISNPVTEEKGNDTTATKSHPGSVNTSNPVTAGNLNVTASTESHPGTVNISNPGSEGKLNDSRTETNIKLPTSKDNSSNNGSNMTESRANTGRRLLEEDSSEKSHGDGGNSDSKNNKNEELKAATVENDEGLEADADQSFELFRDSDDLADEYNYDYDDYVNDDMWGDEEWTETQHEKLEDYVNIDSHILCTPVSNLPL